MVDENVMSDTSVSKTVQKLEIPPIFSFRGPYLDVEVTWGLKKELKSFLVLETSTPQIFMQISYG